METNLDFKELLNIADYNKVAAQDEASIKRYSTALPPPKKSQKSTVQSDGVRRFLEKRKAEEAAKAAEARKQKEQLLALRAQNTKSNKKAKIMASRTKDNDFSRIKLTDDERAAKLKIEKELQQKHLMDKVERMKCRIELEEKEKLQPKKRKRKSKNGIEVEEPYIEEPIHDKSKKFKNSSDIKNSGPKPQRPAPPPMSFKELLEVAQVKQFEPVEIPVQKKKDERLLTKRERRIFEEEQERNRKKLERMRRDELEIDPPKSSRPSKHSSVNEKNLPVEKTNTKKPVVIHIEKDSLSNGKDEFQKFKIPKSNSTVKSSPLSKTVGNTKVSSDKTSKSSSNYKSSTILNGDKHSKVSLNMKSQPQKLQANHERDKYSKNNAPHEKHQVPKQHVNLNREKHSKNVTPSEKHVLHKQPTNHDREKHSKNSVSSSKQMVSKQPTNHDREKVSKPITQVQNSQVKHINKSSNKLSSNKTQFADNLIQKKNSVKIAPAKTAAIAKEVPTINAEEIVKGHLAEMEKKLREVIEKEIKEKMLAELQAKSALPSIAPKPGISKAPEKVKQPNGTHAAMNGKTVKKMPPNRPMPSKKENERNVKELGTSVKRSGPPPPKPFHPNPYLDPPRRRLEPLRPTKPTKRRIESDEDDDDDDDMSDFIDDRTSQNDDDYSKYIQEIFGYDRNKYVDDDDDDIIESSFSQLMKEEKHSAKEGYREDLEEERKLREMEKRRKMKKMKK
ncbi:hypothetical protein NPIL_168301 [Nephila pilipes]|uniref:Protein SPT2 homolog n=1 Tax=Nephila pilipes TaxID=299642 RepID=A0A8X6NSD9_NEPPI|nr:hypothetical protein NPIL_168301 [Nephila pilipes]